MPEPDASDELVYYLVGDSDLVFLGLAAALAARWHFHRKGGRMRGYEGFPQNDTDAIDLVQKGLRLGSEIPPDDVTDLFIQAVAPREVINGLLRRAGHPELPPPPPPPPPRGPSEGS